MSSAGQTLRVRDLPSLSAPADGARFVEVTGLRIALLGQEEGPFECWIWPLKVLSEMRLGLRLRGEPLELGERSVKVTPGELAFLWRDERITLRTEIFACREKPALAMVFALDSDEEVEVELSFRCDLRPMWPAGLGGQLARIDHDTGAFALTEELGRFAVLVGAPRAKVLCEEADHGLPSGPVRILLPLPASGSSAVLAIAGATVEPAPLSAGARLGGEQAATGFARAEPALAVVRELWWRLVSDFSAECEAVRVHWNAVLDSALRLESPERALDEALLWSRIAIERAWVAVDGLGTGLVAGLAPSGAGERPGYGWFFDGDALVASRALALAGDFEGTREVLRFAASHQREDGKLMHELTLSAGLCRWLEDYPYAYYKAGNSAEFVTALEHYVRLSGDTELARELWPAAERAIEWCARCLDDQGRLANPRAGIAAVEAGPLSERIESEVFLQGAWISALGAAARLAQGLGKESKRYRGLEERALSAFEAYWSEEKGRYGFALLAGGARNDDLTAYLAYPLSRGIGERARAWASVQALNDPALATDWGVRMFAADSPLYDPASYNHGAVFPYLTGYATLAHYAHGHAPAAHQVLFSQVALCHFGGLGLLEEHLEGECARVPRRGVPHQIFSSAALIESTLAGLFGIEASAAERRVVFRPSLPPGWDEARLENLRIGESRLDVRFYRRRERGHTLVGVTVDHRDGPSLQVGFAPVLAPLTRLLDGPCWLRASGAVVPRRLHRSRGEGLALEARVQEGPAVWLPWALPPRGERSRAVRLVAQDVGTDRLRWTFAGPAGSLAELPFFSDLEVDVGGAELADGSLRLSFGAGPEGSFTTTAVEVRPR